MPNLPSEKDLIEFRALSLTTRNFTVRSWINKLLDHIDALTALLKEREAELLQLRERMKHMRNLTPGELHFCRTLAAMDDKVSRSLSSGIEEQPHAD